MYQVQVRRTEPLKVASIAHKGPYQNLGSVYQNFQSWLGAKKIQPGGFFREIGYDNPMITPPEECRQEVCVPIAGDIASDDNVQIKHFPELTVASVVHRGGLDFASLGPAYQSLMGWAAAEGKQTTYSIMTYYTAPWERDKAEIEIALVLA